jgi:HPt (histidine-containing phosphotransfer) domain-containing protein
MSEIIDTNQLDELRDSIGQEALIRILKVFIDEMKAVPAQMRMCLSKRSFHDLSGLAHTLKGTSATFGAIGVWGIAQELESAAKLEQLSNLSILIETLDDHVEKAVRIFIQYTQ